MIPAVALLALLSQDITVSVTPEPMALTRALYGNVKEMGTWSVRVCSGIDAPVMVPSARVFIAAANDIRFIAPHRAVALLSLKRQQRKAYRWAKYLGYGLQLGTAATGYARLSPDLVRGLALAIPIFTQAADALREQNPAFDSAELLHGVIRLDAYGCTEGTAFAAIQRNVQPRTYKITLPGVRQTALSAIPATPAALPIPIPAASER